MLAAVLICATLWQEPTVTFTHRCAHSSVVLTALGKEIDMTLRPRGTVDKDYFLVRFKDVPVQEALDNIADTLNATWIGEGKVRYLDRTKEDLQKENVTLFKNIDKFLADNPIGPYPTINELAQQIAGKDALDYSKKPDRQILLALDRFSPIKRASIKVLRSLSKQDIEKLAMEGSVDYYEQPLAMERDLTSKMKAAVQELNRELQVLQVATERSGFDITASSIPGFFGLLRPSNLGAVFGFEIEFEDDGFSIDLLYRTRSDAWFPGIENERGTYIERQYKELDVIDETFIGKPEHIAFFKSLTVSEEGELPNSFAKFTPWTQKALQDLERYEPLGMLKSDALLQLAELKDWNMVALVQDGPLIPSFYINPTSLRNELETILGWHYLELDDSAGFASLKPMVPQQARRVRWDRKAISKAINRSKRLNWFDVGALAILQGTHIDYSGYSSLEQQLPELFISEYGDSTPYPHS